VKETGAAIQEVVDQVGHLNRSWPSNLITADHASLTSLLGNELRKDLRRWITPPDPSVNLHTASDAHHEGTAAWCTKGSVVANWQKSGSLLWIHGKRTCPIIVSVLIVTDVASIHSWFWEEYSQVRYHIPMSCVPIELR
jgi:hypothetical protein